MNDILKQNLQWAYDRACEATSGLSAARNKNTDTAKKNLIKKAYDLSKDLQAAIKNILYS